MMKKIEKQIPGSSNLPISLDLHFVANGKAKPIVIFCHGFKGFKDWGAWNLVAEEFAQNGFVFLKFNFSHNGTTPENLLDFNNLKAFSENNYSKELEDLECVLDFVSSKKFPLEKNELDFNNIFLIGHSRGGAAVLVKGFEEEKLKKITTWASIDSFDRFGTTEQIAKWKQDGEHIFVNGRTGLKMPIKFQFYEDYLENKKRLDIKNAVSKTTKPILVVHGTEDPAVYFESAENIFSWAQNGKLCKVENANHVFDASHPFLEKKLPKHLQKVVNETILFFEDK